MKTLVNPALEKDTIVLKPPLWKRVSAEKFYWVLSLISPLIALLTWQFISYLQIFPTQILVPPLSVWHAFIGLIQSGELQLHLKDSLSRLFFGFSIATISAIAFGVAYGSIRTFRHYTFILFNILYQIPIFVLIPIFILVFGIGELFKILLIIKACFFPIALATSDAVKNIPKQYIEIGQIYKLKTRAWLKYIIIPSILPPLISGLRIALGRAWLILVAVELLAAGTGIGQMMELGRQMLRLDVVMVGVFITGLIGFILDKLLRLLEQRFISPALSSRGK
ncbi:ABC transporter permease [Acinetobacter sp. S40]|uniref:ABC transporter permease n=1 Tax=unclassified Acinetobacter TaxID=196816 RepID=UPI00190923FF|nr:MULTISPECIES: ABC transporter permease [unclassified Acinetobacter]MBJ9984743.1 ABC transporter permease [Acinetobacter sp. S40]MBK0062508.1 ABC transporter permease [Acinetobacter sp. S55]MBK0066312.1 ABC transporter permease [Acinetobacter sp. S54]